MDTSVALPKRLPTGLLKGDRMCALLGNEDPLVVSSQPTDADHSFAQRPSLHTTSTDADAS